MVSSRCGSGVGERWGSEMKEGEWFRIRTWKGDVRRKDIAQECVLVADERECLCELGLCIGVVFKGLGCGGIHRGRGGLVDCRRRGRFLDGAEEGTHQC